MRVLVTPAAGTFFIDTSLQAAMMKLVTIALVTLALVPAAVTAQAPNLTGDWNATFTATASDGRTQSITFTFHFVQKGK